MKIFYCAKCNKIEVGFKMHNNREEKIRHTWTNVADGYSGYIFHMVCPQCGYVLSGYVNWTQDASIDKGVVEYVKHRVRLYSTRESDMLKKGGLDYTLNDIIKKKKEEYLDSDDELAKYVVATMSGEI